MTFRSSAASGVGSAPMTPFVSLALADTRLASLATAQRTQWGDLLPSPISRPRRSPQGHVKSTPTYHRGPTPLLNWAFSELNPSDGCLWEIMVNGPDSIFTKRHSGAGGYHHEVFHEDEHVVRVLTKILDDASRSHRKLDPAEGLQDAQLENGARLHIVHSDVARDGQASERTHTGLG